VPHRLAHSRRRGAPYQEPPRRGNRPAVLPARPPRAATRPRAGRRRTETPLGSIALDRAALRSLADLPQVVRSDPAHALEHALGAPFLQTMLGEFSLVPLTSARRASRRSPRFERLWAGPPLVVSTDLHYHAYAEARRIDAATLSRARGARYRHDHTKPAAPRR
jgi:AmmeMemoRadiSam system protein B